jgi:hypothetical protein
MLSRRTLRNRLPQITRLQAEETSSRLDVNRLPQRRNGACMDFPRADTESGNSTVLVVVHEYLGDVIDDM